MRDLLLLAIHLLVTLAKLLRPGGARAIVVESLLLKHQFVIINRSRQRAPNLSSFDRFVLGLTTLFVSVVRKNSRRSYLIDGNHCALRIAFGCYLIHDRDSIFATRFNNSVRALGLKVLRTPFRSPKANSICERVIGTIRREFLD